MGADDKLARSSVAPPSRVSGAAPRLPTDARAEGLHGTPSNDVSVPEDVEAAGDAACEAAVGAVLGRGDPSEAVRLLAERYADRLHRYCVGFVGAHRAHDVVQIVFEQALRGRFTWYSVGANVRSWLFAVAKHRCLDLLKSPKQAVLADDDVSATPDEAENAEESLVGDAIVRQLAECVKKLRPDIRALLSLRYQEQRTFVEIGKLFSENPATLQYRVATALPVLKRCLEDEGHLL